MIIGKERNAIENALTLVFENYNKDKEIINKIKDEFVERGVSSGEFLSIIDGRVPIETILPDMLCLFAILFYDETKDKTINPEAYFTESEIAESKKFRIEQKEQDRYPVIFENVTKGADDYFSTLESIQTYTDRWHKNIIIYNRLTQRNTVYAEYKDKIIERIKENKEAVLQIKNNIIEGKQITNYVTINILQTGEERFEYDAKNRRLIVYSGELDILDGYHRSKGMILALQEYPTVQFTTGINIVNWDIEKCRRYIEQEDKRTPISKEHTKSIDPESFENLIIKKINDNSDLKGKIVTDKFLIRKNAGLTMHSIVSETLKQLYPKIISTREANNIGEWAIEFFNELVGLYPEAFLTDIATTKEKSYINHENMFVGYITLMKELQNNPEWRKKLEDILKSIDFSKGNPLWTELEIDKSITKKSMLYISKHFKSLI